MLASLYLVFPAILTFYIVSRMLVSTFILTTRHKTLAEQGVVFAE